MFVSSRGHRRLIDKPPIASMRYTTSSILAAAAAASGASAQEFLFTGTNQAGAEFGETVFPGELGRHYTWPTVESIDVCMPLNRARRNDD